MKLHDGRHRLIPAPTYDYGVALFDVLHNQAFVLDAIDDVLSLLELIDLPDFWSTHPSRPRIIVSCGVLEDI